MAGMVCLRCGTDQKYPSVLKRHLARKTPCAAIVDKSDLPESDKQKNHSCRYCGRTFTTATSMHRHTRLRCKIANSEEGMDKLFEHTLQRQLAKNGTTANVLESQNAEIIARIAELTALMKNQALQASHAAGIDARSAIQINTGPVTNIRSTATNTVVQQFINIRPWDGERRIDVSTAQIAAAFAENARLKEYVRLEEHQLTDPEIAPPYVTELLMDLTKRAHADPTARNVYLNPRRSDQALVHMTCGKWEVMSLTEATRLIFDGVAKAMVKVTMSNEERRQLPLEAQNALAMAGLLYDDEPDEYAKRAKAPMTAHLSNTAPAALTQ